MKLKNTRTNYSATHKLIQTYIAPFLSDLKAAGYSAKTLSTKRRALWQFLSWLGRRKSISAQFTETEISRFVAKSLRVHKSKRSVASRALFDFLDYLRRQNVVRSCALNTPETLSCALQKRYADFLRQEKGLAELSLKVYLPVATDLLLYLKERHGITAVRRLDAAILRAFLLERARDRSSESVRLLATSLRSFLRFLHVQSEIARDSTAAIPIIRRWAQPDVPKKLTPEEVNQVLKVPDPETATGRRDYAILLLLARLGLRSSEILSLELGDLRWRTGEIMIRGKGKRQDILPLPRDVGAAIASYLREDRGLRPTRRVFLRTIAPRVPLTGPASIGHIVRRVMAQAGVERPRQIAAHLFRHTLASRMLEHGANLREISEVLRHQAHTSTEIYAKIDRRALQEVIRPWPRQGGAR